MATDFQPTLPAEVPFTEAEENFIDSTPPDIFPENQNSNWGLFRKIWADRIQEIIDQLVLLSRERFVLTSDQFLSEWELDLGLPQNPAGRSITERRVRVLAALRSGLFTKTLRRETVEEFILPYIGGGDPVQLLPGGVPLVAAGVPLYSGATGPVTSFYTIVENVEGFSYTVTINTSLGIDVFALEMALRRITPAHINFVVAGGAIIVIGKMYPSQSLYPNNTDKYPSNA